MFELMVVVYVDFNIIDYCFCLSYCDLNNIDKYFDDDVMWEKV